MTGHVRGDARKRSLESQHRLRIVNGLIVSCMCGAATNTDPYGDAVTTHIIAEARADGAAAVLAAVEAVDTFEPAVDDYDIGYNNGNCDVMDAARASAAEIAGGVR